MSLKRTFTDEKDAFRVLFVKKGLNKYTTAGCYVMSRRLGQIVIQYELTWAGTSLDLTRR